MTQKSLPVRRNRSDAVTATVGEGEKVEVEG